MTDEIEGAIAAERRLLEPAVRSDAGAVGRMLAPDFSEVGASGILWSREAMLDAIAGFSSSTELVDATDFSGRIVADGLVLVSYSTADARRTSLWRRTPVGWQVVFHQGTRVPAST